MRALSRARAVAGEFPDFIYEITYADFTSWFKQRLNIEDDVRAHVCLRFGVII
jgi:hypothetical protein